MVAALARVETGIERAEPFIDDEKVQLLRDTLLKGATELELQLFVTQCEKRRLDPFTRQFYGIKVGGALQMFASIDGLRVIAQRSGAYRGQVGPLWCGTDGEWADVWLQDTPPAAAKVGVLRAGWPEPLWGVATFKSYGAGKQSPVWRTMPDVMLAKAAEALALRKAFPDDMSGIYTPEEIEHEPQAVLPGTGQYTKTRSAVAPVTDARLTKDIALADLRSEESEENDDGIIDAETGEIAPMFAQPEPEGRMTREQGQLIKDIVGKLGWDKAAVQAFSGEVTGLTNASLLSEEQAKDLIQHLLAEMKPETA